MADEPRRSGRATKGQHTKNEEDPPEKTKKRGGKGARSKAAKKEEVEDEEEDAIIRCICGYVVEDKNDKRAMICCDKCLAWQHNVCMGLSEDDDDLPDTYFCEQCKPEDHKETLAAIDRGEHIWDIRQAEAHREEEERKARKRKGGRKSKGGRASEVAPPEKKEAATPAVTQPPTSAISQTPATPAAPPTPKAETGTKRKTPTELPLDASQANDTAVSSKARKVSTPKEPKPPARRQSSAAKPAARRDSKEVPLQAELVDTIEELHSPTRQRAAKALVKLFVDSTQQAKKDGSFKLPTGQNEDAFGLRLGLTVEYSLYMNYWGHGETPNPPYGEKLRTIMHNVKDNKSLRDRLLSGSLSPHDLTNMSSLDMARKELQEQTAQILKESEKQHVLVQDEGPRMRRTHKGEEMIVDESQHMTNNEPVQGTAPRRGSNEGKEASPEQMSPQSPTTVELPPDVGRSPTTARPLTVDTKPRPKPPPQRKQSTSTNFNMDNVWSTVDSPSMNRPTAIPTTPASAATTAPPGPGAKADPEVDALLKDEDEDDEPYSPMDYEMEPGTVWRGNVVMPTIAEFRGSAKHVAGADLHKVYPWNQLMAPVLTIEGRIPVDRASDYLCGLRWSKTTDVSVVSVTPAEHTADRDQFDKLFAYFTSRTRYGVVGKSPVANVRDVYVVPLEAGDAKKPEFIELLQESAVEDVRTTRSLLITYVIKTRTDGAPPPGNATNAGASATPRQPDLNSPMASQGQFRSPSASNPGPAPNQIPGQNLQHMSPLNAQTAFSPPSQQIPLSPPPSTRSKGYAAALAVLGQELVQAPTVGQLLTQAPETGEAQWRVIKEVLEEDVKNRVDWGMFMGGLQRRIGG